MEDMFSRGLTEEVGTKLTDWKNEPKFEDLKGDWDNAYGDFQVVRAKIERYRIWLNGGPKIDPKKPGRSKVRPRLIKKQKEWQYPRLEDPFLSSKELFKIDPRTAEDSQSAIDNSLILNYQLEVQVDKPRFIGDIARTDANDGTVIVKVGWESEYKTVTEEVQETVYATPEQSMQLLKKKIDDGSISKEQAKAIMQTGELIPIGSKIVKKEKEVLTKNQPKYEVRNTKNVMIDPTCDGDIKKAMFIIDEYETNLAELKKNEYKKVVTITKTVDANGNEIEVENVSEKGIYRNLNQIVTNNEDFDQIDYKSQMVTTQLTGSSRKRLKAYDYWGYWDINGDGKLVSIIGTWIGSVLIRLEKNPLPFKKPPFAVAQFMPNEGSPYGDSDIELMSEDQDIIGKLTRASLDIIGSKAVDQKFIHSSVIKNPVAKADYDNGRDVIYSGNVSPRDAIYTNNVEAPSPIIFDMISYYQKEAQEMSGVVPMGGGGGSPLGNSATAARGAMDAVSKRELSILRRINAMLKEVALMTIEMNKVYLEDEFILRITNGKEVTIRRDALNSQMDLIVEISTAEADNERAQELAFMLQTLGNNADPQLRGILLTEIARLRKMPELVQKIEDRMNQQAQPDPQQQQLQQMQIDNAKLQNHILMKQMEDMDSKIYERLSRTDENKVGDEAMKKAKALKEVAQAKQIESATDKLDLDTVEKATGVDVQKKNAEDATRHMNNMELEQMKNKMTEMIYENDSLKSMLEAAKTRYKGQIQ